MRPVFIYALLDPTTLVVRYAGQTVGPDKRLKQHIREAKKEKYHSACWINSLINAGLKPIMEILDVVPDTEADFWEREYIQNFRERGFDLTNILDGGEKPPSSLGRVRSPATRKKMSDGKKGDKNPLFGKVGAQHTSFGRKHYPETCAKISAMFLGGKRPNSSSLFHGVCSYGVPNKWKAYIRIARKPKHLGYFSDEIEAAEVYDIAAKIHYGAQAVLNFPD